MARLHEALTAEKHRDEAAEIIRSPLEKIVLNPAPQGSDATMTIDLHGDLAGILWLSSQTKKPPWKGGDYTESTYAREGSISTLDIGGLPSRAEDEEGPSHKGPKVRAMIEAVGT